MAPTAGRGRAPDGLARVCAGRHTCRTTSHSLSAFFAPPVEPCSFCRCSTMVAHFSSSAVEFLVAALTRTAGWGGGGKQAGVKVGNGEWWREWREFFPGSRTHGKGKLVQGRKRRVEARVERIFSRIQIPERTGKGSLSILWMIREDRRAMRAQRRGCGSHI